MNQSPIPFEQLLGLLQQIAPEEVKDSIAIARRLNAGADVRRHPQRLVQMVSELSENHRLWLKAALYVRAQQTGREDAWTRFARSSFRELTSSHAADASLSQRASRNVDGSDRHALRGSVR